MPRFKSRKDRIHHALRLYHGIGCKEHDKDEIADELDVRRTLVDEYLYETEQAREVKQAFDDIASQTRQELIMDKRARMRELRELEEELRDAVEVVVTDFAFEDVELELESTEYDNVDIPDDSDFTYMGKVPVPNQVKQVPQFKRLQAVWDEMRRTEEELANLMGLSEPEEVSVTGDITQRKFYRIGEDPEEVGYPEQEQKDLDEEESI